MSNRRELAALQDEKLTRRAESSLRVFVECAWRVLEPATPFLPNWHIDLICEWLEAVTRGDVHRLVVNIPPRYMKSILVSVCWPCWEWIRKPGHRWIFASHTESLANRHSIDRRRLLCSEWFQARWGHHIQLVKDQSAKMEFENTRRGVMVATSMGGSVTGKGGNRLVLDDPHNPTQAESDAQREHAVELFQTTLATRLDDPSKDAIILVMQRLHMRDMTAMFLEQGFDHVCLPAIAPATTTIQFPHSARTVRRVRETVLWPGRQTRADLDAQRAMLGAYAFSGQYQQNPVPRHEEIFRREWWQYVDTLPVRFDRVIQSWDLSFKDGAGNDYVVGLVAGCVGPLVYLLDRYKAKASFVVTCQAIQAMMSRYPLTREVLIEDAANGPAVVDVLRQHVHGIRLVKPEGGKYARACAVQPRLEARQVFLPQPRWPDGTLRPGREWVEDFVETCAMFPKGEHDDDVDAFTQLLVKCQKSSGVSAAAILRANVSDRGHVDDDEEEGGDDLRYYRYRRFPG